MAEERDPAAAPATYEYATIRAERDLESLYRDTYVSFGWTVEGYGQALPSTGAVNLKLKRPRHLKNRPEVVQLQRKAEQVLAEIAAELFLSPFTVKTHANRAMMKVGARDRAQLVSYAVQAGIRP
jgi:DNA-binding CsgD family transcriptional regulator